MAYLQEQSLPNLLRYRVNPAKHVEFKRQVDHKLSSAEIAEYTSINRTINESLHDEIAYDLGPRQLTVLIPIAKRYKVSESVSSLASSVASHMHELHKEISDKVAQNNANYTL